MAYDEAVAERVRSALGKNPDIVEKKMFGGLAFMLHGNMCCGVIGDRLMLRVGRRGTKRPCPGRTRGQWIHGKTDEGWSTSSPRGLHRSPISRCGSGGRWRSRARCPRSNLGRAGHQYETRQRKRPCGGALTPAAERLRARRISPT